MGRVQAPGNELPRQEPAPDDEAYVRANVDELRLGAREAEGLGDHDTAAKNLQKAAALAQALGDQRLVGDLLVACAEVFSGMGEYRMALRFLGRAKEIAQEWAVPELKGEVYRGFGAYYKARGDLESAAVCYDRALERLEFTARHRSVRRAILDLSEVYLKQGRAPEAQHLLERADKLPTEEDTAVDVRLRLNRGRLAHLKGDGRSAVAHYEEAAAIAKRAERAFDREIIAIGLARLYVHEGRLEDALANVREALALSVIAFAREAMRPLERARFIALGELLREIAALGPPVPDSRPLGTPLDEAVRLHDTHPFVLTGALPAFAAHVNAHAPPLAVPPAASEAPAATER